VLLVPAALCPKEKPSELVWELKLGSIGHHNVDAIKGYQIITTRHREQRKLLFDTNKN